MALMSPAALLFASLLPLLHGRKCDLPVIPIRPGKLPSEESEGPWRWAEAFGISRQTWQDITGGDDELSRELKQLLEKGLVDYGDTRTGHLPSVIKRKAWLDPKRAWRVVKSVLEEPSVGDIYGNALVAE